MSLWADGRIGTTFAGYAIDAAIGAGEMSNVYRATAPDGATVALKIVGDELSRDPHFRQRFNREAEIARTVRNPHLVEVFEVGEEDGTLYLAAEFVDGGSLDSKLKSEGPLDVGATLRVCEDVAEGLEALWSAGMVHRDIKPANILLDRSGMAYITDFGLAKDTHGSALTRTGQALGSLDYMAPEQIRGDPVTGAADIYSLGCVVFECLQGRPPFADREGLRVLWAHLQSEPPDPAVELPAEFVHVLKSALRKQPEDRPRGAREYVDALSRAAVADLVPAAC